MDRLDQPGSSSFNSISQPPYTNFTPTAVGTSAGVAVLGQKAPSTHKKRRYRPIRSCLPCYERKLQCDRGHPCKKCVDRKMTEQCIYRPPIPPSLRYLAHSQSLSESDLCDNEASDAPTSEAECQMTPSNLQSAQAIQQVDSQQYTNIAGVLSLLGQLLSQRGGDEGSSSAECSRHTGKLVGDLAKYFPSPTLTSWLLKHFFEHSPVLPLWPVLHRRTFERSYSQFHDGPSPTSQVILLAIVCLLSLQSLPESPNDAMIFHEHQIGGRDGLKTTLYEFSTSLLTSFEVLTQPTVEEVKSLLLLSTYLLNEGNYPATFGSSGNAIRMAQLAQMHQHAIADTMDPSASEFSRILWWSLFLLDRQQCYLFQRPYMIYEQHYQIPLPETIHYFADQCGGLSDALTDNSFLLAQIKWARLVGTAWDVCATHSTIGELLRLEKAFYEMECELPLPLRIPSALETTYRGITYFQGLAFCLRTCHIRARILLKLTKCLRCFPTNERLQESRNGVRDTCVGLCQKILAHHVRAQQALAPSYLCWGEFSVISFDAALFLVASALMDAGAPRKNGYNLTETLSWIMLSQSLLEKAPLHDFQARRAVKAIDTLRNVMLSGTYPTSIPRPTLYPDIDPELVEAEPVPLAAVDIIPADDILDYSLSVPINYPEIDLLSDENFVDRVQSFLDSCVASS